jgi:ABC-type transporter Mla maintaining outer membrane lipid asymmetry permease subunit MlaE
MLDFVVLIISVVPLYRVVDLFALLNAVFKKKMYGIKKQIFESNLA